MSKKIPIGIAIALILVFSVLTAVVTVSVYLHMYNDLINDLPQRSQQYAKLTGIDELVRSNYYGDINYDELDANIAAGYINGIGDPHSVYISPDDYELYESFFQGRLPGTGLEVEYNIEKICFDVISVAEGSPAEEKGIEPGAVVVSVDGEQVTGKNYKELREKLTGSLKKSVKFALAPDDNSDPVSIELNNGYSEKSCYYSVNGSIGYIRLSAINNGTDIQFAEAISRFTDEAVTGIILDLRNCSSINLDVAAKITDMIVPVGNEGTGAIYTAKNAEDKTIKVYSSDSACVSLRLAVLVNDRTECAAELIACDLRDFGKAVIIGETTAGHGKMQQLFRLDDGGAVLLSVAEIYPYTSESFDNKGVIPDAEIITNDIFKNSIGTADVKSDIQYQKAYSYLTGE